MDPSTPVAPVVCTVDWGPVVLALQTVLIGVAGLLSAYTVRLIQRNGRAKPHGRRSSDTEAP